MKSLIKFVYIFFVIINIHPQNIIRLHESESHQTELSAFARNGKILVGANISNYAGVATSQGYYYSTNSGNNWSGSDNLSGSGQYSTDPAVVIDKNGHFYFCYIDKEDQVMKIFLTKSTNNGGIWSDRKIIKTGSTDFWVDKSYMTIGYDPNNQDNEILYFVWSKIQISNGTFKKIYFCRSTDGGETFVDEKEIGTVTEGNHAAYPVVGSNNELFIVWAVGSGGPYNQTQIMITKSTDGGVSFDDNYPRPITTVTQIGNQSTNYYTLKGLCSHYKPIRVNSFPSISVDASGGTNDGHIYVTWADQRYGSPDILMTKSTDGGLTWSDSPKTVHTSSPQDQWMPWISIGSDGAVNIVYYDSRSIEGGNCSTAVYLSRSLDGGNIFSELKVNELDFVPFNLNMTNKYWGDYINIVTLPGKVFPFWYAPLEIDNDVINQAFTNVLNFPQITLLQEFSEGGSVGEIKYWEQLQSSPAYWSDPVELGNPISFLYESIQSFLADEAIHIDEKEEKFNKWDVSLDPAANPFVKEILGDATYTSQFKPITENVQIRNLYELISSVEPFGDTIYFEDPWNRNYANPSYNYYLTNRGNAALPVLHDSPIDFANPIFQNYQGVFLDQGYNPITQVWTPPYYSVKAESPQEVTLYNTGVPSGRLHNFYFQNWTATPAVDASFQNANAVETGVVFKNDGVTINANLKGTQLSNQTDAFDNSSQRKFIKTNDGIMHHVYESMGKVFYEKSTNS